MTSIGDEKRTALQWLDANTGRLSGFHLAIWEHAETAWREYRSAADYVSLLESEGFSVERGSGEMPTAFAATWGSGRPVIASYAEYDAVPGNSQQAIPRRAPREGSHPWAPGHTDPHSALGVGALAGVLAAKEAMSGPAWPGRSSCSASRPRRSADPSRSTPRRAITTISTRCSATIRGSRTPPSGTPTAAPTGAACSPSSAWTRRGGPTLRCSPFPGGRTPSPRSPGALDAVSLMYTVTKYTKENMYPHDGSWIMNEFLMVGGQATADNLVPRIAQIQYCWRSPTLGDPGAALPGAGQQRAAGGRRRELPGLHALGQQDQGRPAQSRPGRRHLRELPARRPAAVPGRGEGTSRRQIQLAEGIPPMDDPFTARCQTLTHAGG